MPITREQTKYISTNDTVFLPSVAVDSNLGVRGTSLFDGNAIFNNGIRISSGSSIFSGTIDEYSIVSGLHAGVQNGTPRLMFAPPGSTSSANNWQIDVSAGTFRWFTPGIVQMSLTPSSSGGTVSVNQVIASGTITLSGPSPTITSTNPTAASVFPSTVTGITIGSSTIKTTVFPADGTVTAASAASGYMGMPRGNSGNAITGAYAITAADAGKHLYITTTGQTVTIPANGSVALPIGTTIVFVNGSGVTTTIAITTDTLRQANTSNTGSRTLASNGMATLVKINTTEWIIGGNGLS